MLSVIILVPAIHAARPHPFAPLLRTLACLVPATVEGVVRDVILAHVGQNEGIATIANEAGCTLVQRKDFATALDDSVGMARAAWILVLRAGAIPNRGFGEEAAAALDRPEGTARSWLMREDRGALGRILLGLAPVAGVITPRTRLERGGCATFLDIIRRTRPSGNLPTRVPVLGG